MSTQQDQPRRGRVLYADIRHGADGVVVGLTCDHWLHSRADTAFHIEGEAWDGYIYNNGVKGFLDAVQQACAHIELRNIYEGVEPRGKIFITLPEDCTPITILNLLYVRIDKPLLEESQEVDDTVLQELLGLAAHRLFFPYPQPLPRPHN